MSDLSNRSDQFDIRLNISKPFETELIADKLDAYSKTGAVRYCHISGIEMGDNPDYSSFGKLHVHIALILYNFTSKRAIVRRLVAKDQAYYVEPRDKTKSLQGWLDYHTKPQTKIDPQQRLLYRYGEFPQDRIKRKVNELTPAEETKKRQKVIDWARKKHLMVMNDWDTLDEEFPGFIYSSMGQSMKREIMKQANDEFTQPLQGKLQNFIIWGPSGSGKSSSVALLYPNCYKKQKGSQYWDAYDKTNPDHQVVWIDEMSKETLRTFSGKVDGGFEFLKELADRYAVTVDEKYTKGYKIRPKKIIITMNEHPTSLLPDRAVEVNKKALFRKFKILYVDGKHCDLPYILNHFPTQIFWSSVSHSFIWDMLNLKLKRSLSET